MVRVYAGSVATGLSGGWHDTLVLRRGPYFVGSIEQLAARFGADVEAVESVLNSLGVKIGRAESVTVGHGEAKTDRTAENTFYHLSQDARLFAASVNSRWK